MRYCLIFVLIVVSVACHTKMLSLGEEQIIHVDTGNKSKEFDLYSLLDTNFFDVVPLETEQEYLIGEISHLFVENGKYYIIDKVTKAIYVFAQSGEFISKIQNIGRGSSEYTQITDAFFYKHHIYIVDINMGKFLVYDTAGVFKYEKRINDLWAESIFIHNDRIFYINDWSKAKGGCYRLYSTDLEGGDQQKTLGFSSKEYTRGWGLKNFYAINQEHVTFIYSSIDTIYQVGENNSIKKYYIDFGAKKLPLQLAKLPLPELLRKHVDREYILGINFIQECNHYLFFNFREQDEEYYVIYDKKKHENQVFQNIVNSGFVDIYPFVFTQNYLVSIHSAYSILQLYEFVYKNRSFPNQGFQKLLQEKMKGLKETDNPVLFFYKLKDE